MIMNKKNEIMKFKIKKSPILKCNICGELIPCNDDLQLNWEEISRYNNRPQGIEITYQSDFIDIHCLHCGNKIEYHFEVTEYPEGVIEDIDINLNGGTIFEKPKIEISDNY